MVLIYNNNTYSNNMFHSFFRNLFGAEKCREPSLKRNLGGKLYSPKDMQARRLKFEVTVLNGTFQQREKCSLLCGSVTGMVHTAKYPNLCCSGVHPI